MLLFGRQYLKTNDNVLVVNILKTNACLTINWYIKTQSKSLCLAVNNLKQMLMFGRQYLKTNACLAVNINLSTGSNIWKENLIQTLWNINENLYHLKCTILLHSSMHSSAKRPSPPFSAIFFCSSDTVLHNQEVCFL